MGIKEGHVGTARRLLALAIAGLALAVPGAAHAAIVSNGDFETGNLSGWQTQDSGSISPQNKWYSYSGTTSPLNLFTVHAPPQGSFAAITDQGGPGAHFLYQDLALPVGGTQLQLSMLVYYDSDALLSSPNSLDSTTPNNQQYRVDLIRPSAPLDTVSSGDILTPVFRTQNGDPATLDPVPVTVDLAPLAGQTVRLRLAEVDNQSFFNASADAIAVNTNAFTTGKATLNKKKGTAKVPVTVPDPGTLTLAGNGVKPAAVGASKSVAVGTGTVNLLVKATGEKKRKLNSTGKVKVKVTITYTPTGLSPNSQTLKLKLKKKLKKT
jgi:hypothetical protein